MLRRRVKMIRERSSAKTYCYCNFKFIFWWDQLWYLFIILWALLITVQILSLLTLNVGQPQICCGKLIQFALPSTGDIEQCAASCQQSGVLSTYKRRNFLSSHPCAEAWSHAKESTVCVTSLLARVHCLTAWLYHLDKYKVVPLLIKDYKKYIRELG